MMSVSFMGSPLGGLWVERRWRPGAAALGLALLLAGQVLDPRLGCRPAEGVEELEVALGDAAHLDLELHALPLHLVDVVDDADVPLVRTLYDLLGLQLRLGERDLRLLA